MSWNEPGQNPRDPWGQRGGRQEGPPDLDEVFRNVRNKLDQLFGQQRGRGGAPDARDGEGGGAGGLLALIGLAIVLWLAFDSFHIVDTSERGVVLRFGEFNRVLTPGPRFTLPRPFETVTKVNVTQVRSSNNTALRMLTRDEAVIDVDFGVQYTVNDARNFLFRVRDPELTLAQTAEAAIRQVVGSQPLDSVLVGERAALAQEAKGIMQGLLDLYGAGILVTAVNFTRAEVPQEVREAFDDAIRAREDQQRIINEATAYASKVVPEARGQAARKLQEAQGYRDALIARAQGEAERFILLLQEYRQAPEVTRKRLYLETMQEVMSRTPKVIVEGGNNNVLYLPLDRMLQALPQNPARPQLSELPERR